MTAHCRRCGAVLTAGRPATCPSCGAEDWGNAKPCAAALVVLEDRVLLLRRAHAPWHGRWCAPSGFCDGPEHPIDTAERETLEEAGLEIRVVGYLGTWISPYADDGVETDEYVSVQYYAATPVGEPTLEPNPAEVSETGWFDPADPPLGLGPDRVLRAALTALRTALTAGAVRTPLPDRPRRAS